MPWACGYQGVSVPDPTPHQSFFGPTLAPACWSTGTRGWWGRGTGDGGYSSPARWALGVKVREASPPSHEWTPGGPPPATTTTAAPAPARAQPTASPTGRSPSRYAPSPGRPPGPRRPEPLGARLPGRTPRRRRGPRRSSPRPRRRSRRGLPCRGLLVARGSGPSTAASAIPPPPGRVPRPSPGRCGGQGGGETGRRGGGGGGDRHHDSRRGSRAPRRGGGSYAQGPHPFPRAPPLDSATGQGLGGSRAGPDWCRLGSKRPTCSPGWTGSVPDHPWVCSDLLK